MSIERSIVFNFHKEVTPGGITEDELPAPEEGGVCPSCVEGRLEWKPAENCSCHIVAPCGQCENTPLYCCACGSEFRL